MGGCVLYDNLYITVYAGFILYASFAHSIVINNSSTLIPKISYKYIASMGHSTEHSPPPPTHTHTQRKFEVNPHSPFR